EQPGLFPPRPSFAGPPSAAPPAFRFVLEKLLRRAEISIPAPLFCLSFSFTDFSFQRTRTDRP
ncbi:hypothetical protein, partial [uncultured Treponema sp.]|uniref:hypothetical protein n=1 Tax=uncultured Treponema sp. TaxID=162155 RepID=UPI0025FE11E0